MKSDVMERDECLQIFDRKYLRYFLSKGEVGFSFNKVISSYYSYYVCCAIVEYLEFYFLCEF